MKFRLNKKDKTIKQIDTRIEVPQEFKDLYKALAIIERNNWSLYDDISDLLCEVIKYNEEGYSMFDELFTLNKKYKLDK